MQMDEQRSTRAPAPSDLTIAICTIGRSGYLQAALQSLLDTTPPGVTLRVVLNAPDDPNMFDAISAFVDPWDGPVDITLLDERLSIAGSHNAALALVTTEFVTFMGDDDLVLEPRVERILGLFATMHPTPAVIGSFCRRVSGDYDHPRFTTNKDYGPTTIEGWREVAASDELIELVFPSAVYRTKKLTDIGGFEERFGSAMDLATLTQIGRTHPVLADPRRTFAHRIHDGSITSSNAPEHAARLRYTRVCMDALRSGSEQPNWETFSTSEAAQPIYSRLQTARSTLSETLFRQGGAAFASGSTRKGLQKVLSSAVLSPSMFLQRSKSQSMRAETGEPVVAVLLKNTNQYRVPFYERLRPALADKGVELRLIVADGMAEDQAKGDSATIAWAEHRAFREVTIAGRTLLWQPGFDVALGADLVITEQASKQLFNIALSLGQGALNTRHAFWGHGKNFQRALEGTDGEGLKRRLTERAHWFFAYNDLSAKAAIEAGMPADRVSAIMNSTDTDSIREVLHSLPANSEAAVRAELGAGEGPIVLFLGGLYPPKRPDFLLEAAIELRSLVSNVELLVIGSGSQADLINAAAIEHDWIHATGAIYGNERVRLASVAALQVMPGMVGLNIVDGFALGLPTITTDIDYHSPEIDYLIPGENGMIVPAKDSPERYAQSVAHLLGDPEQLARLRNGARRTGKELTIDNMVARFVDGVMSALAAEPR